MVSNFNVLTVVTQCCITRNIELHNPIMYNLKRPNFYS